MNNEPVPSPTPRRLWPWLLLAAVVAAALLAFLWVSAEVNRVKRFQRFDYTPAPPATNDTLAGFRDALTGALRSTRRIRNGGGQGLPPCSRRVRGG